ncbi:hypothetical protein GCM10007981_06930 [Thermocladium modestius]|uniref:Uncharacterized protein n=1 Tax=Thermocladium modestius TaxID=62609 RepID=A0A830GXB6_9CREN|nr:hypothetical protein [Thermocladium modestius]GGP20124.1 hypothetical protein GCM10007981_06930 [Thermocladium modestius]
MIVSLVVDMLFSIIVLVMTFGIFNGLIYDYKLLSSLSHLLDKNIKIKLSGGSLDLSFLSSIIKGAKITGVYLDSPEYGSTFTEGDKATVRFNVNAVERKNIMLNIKVSINGKMDVYSVKKKMRITLE